MQIAKQAEPVVKKGSTARPRGSLTGAKEPMGPGHCMLLPLAPSVWYAPGRLQAKLHLGQPGDRYEVEADQLADRVMRLPTPGVQAKPG